MDSQIFSTSGSTFTDESNFEISNGEGPSDSDGLTDESIVEISKEEGPLDSVGPSEYDDMESDGGSEIGGNET